ncbi:MAG: tRNA pseudouridine(55) synthase TruB [Peptococcaceae bacterium]|jgi:tRNA pseudouridine55 synthase|nr:tRNA pseudouridine(55) synthase TruB [Peptococcaceae bacterium]
MEGVLNVLKPPGMTSHDVVAWIRKTLGERRVGHGGTLDPQAAGVLVVCLGQATRLLEWASGGRKRYLAEMTLGIRTDTQDAWGEITGSGDWRRAGREEIGRAADEFTRRIWQAQKTPVYSAVKLNGIPMHERLRRGMETQERLREVAIYGLEIIDIKESKVKFWVECSGGTYIRTLCHDWGERLGTGAHMSFLLRLSVGPFALEQSHTLEEIRERGEALLRPKECLVAHMRRIQTTEEETERLLHGRTIEIREKEIRERISPGENAEGTRADGQGRFGAAARDDGGDSQAARGGEGVWAAAMTPAGRLAAVGKLTAAGGGAAFRPVKVFDGVRL